MVVPSVLLISATVNFEQTLTECSVSFLLPFLFIEPPGGVVRK